MPLKRRRFNWKARQQARGESRKVLKSANIPMDRIVVENERDGYVAAAHEMDSNALVLQPKKRKACQEREPKRSKLSSRERKKLKKILEAKEKKAKVSLPFQLVPTTLHVGQLVYH